MERGRYLYLAFATRCLGFGAFHPCESGVGVTT